VTVQNSQFSIHIRFANNANGHIRWICTRRLIFVTIFNSERFFWRNQRTRITTNRTYSGRTIITFLRIFE